ncbi:ATPase RavA stimulator ViaA [Edwardsiella tarda]|uniref:ATPase RavA stimulator ViaA n=1 Tax=Edwardsiella tarda TaxID=636 RepID=UPI00351C9BFB
MPSLEAVEAFLVMNESELLQDFLVGLIAAPQLAAFFEKHPRLRQLIDREWPGWQRRLRKRISETNVPDDLAQEFTLYQHQLLLGHGEFFRNLPTTLNWLTNQDSPFNHEAHQLCPQGNFPHSDSFHVLFLQRWRLSLVARTLTLHHQVMEEERALLQQELQQRLQLSGALEPVLAENENAAGRLWDLSRSTPQHGDYQLLVQYGDFLAGQPDLQQLAERLGRSRAAEAKEEADTQQEIRHVLLREPSVMPEEVSGIHQSDEILRLMPSELSILGLSELEYEFYRRLLEKRLMTYRLQGDAWREQPVQRLIAYHHHQQQPKGPFIVCVDTSGSMGGFHEQCAKAFCLALMRIALADNRRCYIMLFSSDIVQHELTADDGIDQAIRFLSQRFRGGTDLARCLAQTSTLLQQPAWQQADAVVISDFIAQRLPEETQREIKQLQKQNGHCFHAVAMSPHGKPSIMKVFDYIWRFDSGIKGRLLRRWRR